MDSNLPNIPKVRPLVGVGTMILRDNKVLLAQRRGSLHGAATYGWVGGHLEFGETLEEAAIRKAYEESRLRIGNLKLLCVSNIIAYNRHYIDFEFLTQEVDGEPKRMKTLLGEWGWYDLDNLPSPLFKAIEIAIQSYKTGQVYFP